MRALLVVLLLLLFASHAPAESFHLLSCAGDTNRPTPPLPFNPHPDAPRYRVTEDIWLVNDLGSNAPIEPTLSQLRQRVDDARMGALLHALTNEPVSVLRPPAVPRATFVGSNWLSPEVNDWQGLQLMEAVSPGFTNSLPASRLSGLTNRLPETNRLRRMQQLPRHINKDNPNWRQELEQWKEENLTPKERGSGGGDYQFRDTLFYQLTIRPLPAPTPLPAPEWSGSGWSWPLPKPSLSGYAVTGPLGTQLTFLTTNSTALQQVELLFDDLFAAHVFYPNEVGYEPNAFPALEVNFWGECDNNLVFDVTNKLHLPAGSVAGSWLVRPKPDCFLSPPLFPGIDVLATSFSGPTVTLWDWQGIRRGFPRIQPPSQPPPLFPHLLLQMQGAGFRDVVLQSTATPDASWVTVTNVLTQADGYAEVELPMNAPQQFYRTFIQ